MTCISVLEHLSFSGQKDKLFGLELGQAGAMPAFFLQILRRSTCVVISAMTKAMSELLARIGIDYKGTGLPIRNSLANVLVERIQAAL